MSILRSCPMGLIPGGFPTLNPSSKTFLSGAFLESFFLIVYRIRLDLAGGQCIHNPWPLATFVTRQPSLAILTPRHGALTTFISKQTYY